MPAALPDDVRALYDVIREPIRERLNDFAGVQPDEYFYELCYCLLTPQSSARNVGRAVEILERRDFYTTPFDPVEVLRAKEHYVRFHLTKAKRLLGVRRQYPEIYSCLLSRFPVEAKRAWLVEHVNGLSLKEASHFLRNIGERDLAILDRHILTHLVACGVIRKKPVSLTSQRYFAIERKFKRFSTQMGIPMDELDLLFWSAQTGEILK